LTPDAAIAPLILGSGGTVGRALTHLLEERFPRTVSATRTEIDVTDRSRLEAEVERLRPTVLINCAALSDPEDCEADPDRARRVNVVGAENAARAAAACGCRLVHVSTASVFDGRSDRPYRENDPPEPLSVHGRTKLEGERRVAEAAEDHLIVRTSWLYGRGCAGFVETIRRGALGGVVLRVASDESGSPTSVGDLAGALLRLLSVNVTGLVHFANSGICSRFAMAEMILEVLGHARAVLEPVAADRGTVVVPVNAALETALYTRLTGSAPRSWQAALRDYLAGEPWADD
jgi:dTDP-4-dehydrorhamnose reductase